MSPNSVLYKTVYRIMSNLTHHTHFIKWIVFQKGVNIDSPNNTKHRLLEQWWSVTSSTIYTTVGSGLDMYVNNDHNQRLLHLQGPPISEHH